MVEWVTALSSPRDPPTGIPPSPGLVARQPHKTQIGRLFMLRSIDHFIGGSAFASGERPEGRTRDVFDPNQGQVQAQVRLWTAADLQKAVDAARAPQPGWAATNPQRRAPGLSRSNELIQRSMDSLLHLLSSQD